MKIKKALFVSLKFISAISLVINNEAELFFWLYCSFKAINSMKWLGEKSKCPDWVYCQAYQNWLRCQYSLTFLSRDLHRLRRLMWSWWSFREMSQGNISLFLTANYACENNCMMFSWTGKAKFSELSKKNQAIENHSSCFYCLKNENREWLSKSFLIIFILFLY